jgi:hypothetical protein
VTVLRLLTANLGWKLLALALAVFLWSTLVGNPSLTKSISAPVEFKNVPKDIEISSEIPERVHLEIQGPEARLSAHNLERAAVILNLSAVTQPGERTFFVEQASIELPPGVELLRAVPSQLRLQFERSAVRELPVQVKFSIPPPGFRVLSTRAIPAQVKIAGPESHVNGAQSATTDTIDVSGVVGEKVFHVKAFVPDPLVRFQSSPDVTVRVIMEKIPQEASPGGESVVRH